MHDDLRLIVLLTLAETKKEKQKLAKKLKENKHLYYLIISKLLARIYSKVYPLLFNSYFQLKKFLVQLQNHTL
ncbi:MAG: hypothetical protein ABDH37_04495 [Candidatus Hydrothermales bacterium]